MRATPEACGNCDERSVIRTSYLTAHEGHLLAHVARDPDAVFRKSRQSTKLVAFVCTSCGFTELYAEDPASLIAP